MHLSNSGHETELCLGPDLAEGKRARAFLRGLMDGTGLSPERAFDVQVAVSEAVANSIEHAHGHGCVRVRVKIHPRSIQVRIWGPGTFHVPEPAARLNRGLGLPLMASLSDRLTLSSCTGQGTLTELVFNRPKPVRPAHGWGASEPGGGE